MTRVLRIVTSLMCGVLLVGAATIPSVTQADIWNPNDFSDLGGLTNLSPYEMGLELQILQLQLQLIQVSPGNNMGFASIGSVDGAIGVSSTTATSTLSTTLTGGPAIVSTTTLATASVAIPTTAAPQPSPTYIASQSASDSLTTPPAVGSLQGYVNGRMFANYGNTTRDNAIQTCANQDALDAQTASVDRLFCFWNGEVVYSSAN